MCSLWYKVVTLMSRLLRSANTPKSNQRDISRWFALAKSIRTCLIVVVALVSQTAAVADDLNLSGLVLDRSISRFGKDFSYYYSAYWRDLPATEGMTLVIHEQVFPQAGTLLWLELNQRRIYQTYLGRRHQDVRQFAEQAVFATIEEIARVQSAQMLGADGDLDDLGIEP